MADYRYSSVDFYKVLNNIEHKVRDLVCDGKHDDLGAAHKDLLEFVIKEREACAIRAARTAAEARRRQRPVREISYDAE